LTDERKVLAASKVCIYYFAVKTRASIITDAGVIVDRFAKFQSHADDKRRIISSQLFAIW